MTNITSENITEHVLIYLIRYFRYIKMVWKSECLLWTKIILGHIQKKKTVESEYVVWNIIIIQRLLDLHANFSVFSSISYFKKERSIEVCVRFQTWFFSSISKREDIYYFVRLIFLTYSISYSMFSSTLLCSKKPFSIYKHAIYLVFFSLCLLKFGSWVVYQFAIWFFKSLFHFISQINLL